MIQPSQHTLAVAGLLFCQGKDDWQSSRHTAYIHDERKITVEFSDIAYTSSPTVLFASVAQALQLLQTGNEGKKEDDGRMEILGKEEMVVGMCLSVSQNATNKALKARYMTT